MRDAGVRLGTLCMTVALACVGDPRARTGAAGAGGKADEAAGSYDPNLSTHRNAVGACIATAAAEREYRDPAAVEADFQDCIVEANDEVWSVVQDSLPDEIYDRRARDHRRPRVDETTKIVDVLRRAQEDVCVLLAEAMVDTDDEAYVAEMELRCRAQAELGTANLVDAHVDLGKELVPVPPPWMRYGACHHRFKEQSDDDVRDALFELRDCAKEVDAESRVPWARVLVERDAEGDLGLREAVIEVSDAFEFESRVAWDLCRLLVHASPRGVDIDVAEAQCAASATIQVGRLVEVLEQEPAHEDDEEDDDDREPEPEPEPDPDPPVIPADGEVCFPGPEGDGSVCFPLVYAATPEEDYLYASALNGDPNYREPIAFIDLDAVDASVRITADFTLGEVAHRSKGRFAVVQPHAVASLQLLRDDVGAISVNSGYRSPAYNKGVGGATYSRHMYGDGFDLDPNEVSLEALENACQHRGGFLVEYSSHVHCDFRLDDVDESFFGPG